MVTMVPVIKDYFKFYQVASFLENLFFTYSTPSKMDFKGLELGC